MPAPPGCGSFVGADDPYPFCPFETLSRPLLAFGHFPPPGGIGLIRPLCKITDWYLGISPAGEFLLQRCKRNQMAQATFSCPFGAIHLETAGGGSRAFTMPYPAAPRTPSFSTGEPSRGGVSPSGAGKRQDTIPCAARCRSVLIEQAYFPTRAIAPGFPPSRGGSVVAPPPGLVPDT